MGFGYFWIFYLLSNSLYDIYDTVKLTSLLSLLYHIITESFELEGTSGDIQSNSPAKAGPSKAGKTETHPGGFLMPPERDTAWPHGSLFQFPASLSVKTFCLMLSIVYFFFSSFSFISQTLRDAWKYFSSSFRSSQNSAEGIQNAFLWTFKISLYAKSQMCKTKTAISKQIHYIRNSCHESEF